MKDKYEVLSAFLDGESVDPVELEEALTDTDGRALLIDLVALRQLVDEGSGPGRHDTAARRHAPRRMRALSAAAIVLASILGYAIGQIQEPATGDAPPVPSRVVRVTTDWQ